MEKRGIFIVFEGIDGSGKTTQAKKFMDYLLTKDKHNHVIFTRNPYKDINIRGIVREDSDPLSKAEKLAELFIQDREQQASELIIPNLRIGCNIISDRYKLSTISYQVSQGMNLHYLIERQKLLPVPDITFIIDIPTIEANKRMQLDNSREKGKTHKFEENLDFLEKVRQNYLKIKEVLDNEKIFVIAGNRLPDEIFEDVKKVYEENFS